MDERKRKELEDLKKQIDPKILERVAKSMGTSVPEHGGAPAASAPAKPSMPKPKSSGGLRKPKQYKPLAEEPKEKPVQFIIFDSSHFRAKQLSGFLNRLGFKYVSIVSDPVELTKSLITNLGDARVQKLAFVASIREFNVLNSILKSEDFAMVREKLPDVANIPTFVFTDEDSAPIPREVVDPKYVLSLDRSPGFSEKKIKGILEIHD